MTRCNGAKRWLVAAALGISVSCSLAADLPDPFGFSAYPPDPVKFAVSIEGGRIEVVRNWLDKGLDPEFEADRVGTGLMLAAWEGNVPMMELFVSRGADVNRMNARQEQALMFAAWKGRLEAVRWLLDRGARVNQEGSEWSALHYAAFAGHKEVARLLVERGADLNARSPNLSTPLMMAAREGKEDAANLLLGLGADTTLVNDRGDDALAFAMRYGHARIAKAVASPERFSEAVRQPPGSFGPRTRSDPIPEKIETLEREMRAADAEGRLTDDLLQSYFLEIQVLEKQQRATLPPAPKALEIRAKRGEPGKEKATLIYDDSRAQEISPPTVSPPKSPARGAPAARELPPIP